MLVGKIEKEKITIFLIFFCRPCHLRPDLFQPRQSFAGSRKDARGVFLVF
jgi:hypothetical protein